MKQLTQEQLEQVYRERPEWRTDIEVGKWYKMPDNDNFLFCVTELISSKSAYGYGWNMLREWRDVGNQFWGTDNLIPATHGEVEAALIAEAKRRYRDGDKVDRLAGCYLGEGNSMVIQRIEYSSMESGGSIWVDSDNDFSICLFTDGKWAAVITPGNDISADIQALKDKYPNYNWTIIAEEK